MHGEKDEHGSDNKEDDHQPHVDNLSCRISLLYQKFEFQKIVGLLAMTS